MRDTRKKPLLAERGAAFSRGEIRLLGAAVILAAATSLVLTVLDADAGPGFGAQAHGPDAAAASD